MKVLFLDIDGVLNSRKTALLHGSVFKTTEGCSEKLDPYGCLFIKRLHQHGVKIVLSSTWRGGQWTEQELESFFMFPIHSRTCWHPFKGSVRGDEIKIWLNEHPEATHYCIVDDDSDMLVEQMDCFVKLSR